MARLRESLAFKTFAVILSYFSVLCLIISAFSVILMGYYKVYFSNPATVTKEVLTDMAQNEAYYLATLFESEESLDRYYEDKNVYYTVTERETGVIKDSNYNGEKAIASAEDTIFLFEWYPPEKSEEIWKKYGENAYYQTDGIEVEKAYDIKLYIAEDMTKNDLFSTAKKIVEFSFKIQYLIIFIFLFSLIITIASLCYLYSAAGHKAGEISLNYIDKLPFDVYTLIVAAAAVITVIGISEASYYNFTYTAVFTFVIGTIDYFLALGYTMSLATRVKLRVLIKNTLLYRLTVFLAKGFKKLGKAIKFLLSNISLVKKTVMVLSVIVLLEIIIALIVEAYVWIYNRTEVLIALIITANVIFALAALYFAIILQKIKKGGEKIAGGELEHKIDSTYMFGDFKDFAQSLNNINDGLQSAVNEKMKSERFKTELITNVSHDIKTPLTSIINYVDLIKKEKTENETVKQYIDVLDRQSGRLKKLVEDLVEASKASTGNLTVNYAPCDVGVLLEQTLGEFSERLEKVRLSTVLNIPEEKVEIWADGRHLWRIFENLMSNICKYSLEGTRVYIDVLSQNKKTQIIFRNISKYQLNVSSDELTERFVRGDSSRNTEGSGLGLSISKSLAELQNGEMNISIDGDLFKVVLQFDLIKD